MHMYIHIFIYITLTFTIPFSLVFHIESIPLILHKLPSRRVFPTNTMPHSLIHIPSYLMSKPYQTHRFKFHESPHTVNMLNSY